jgi:hypothetical protein
MVLNFKMSKFIIFLTLLTLWTDCQVGCENFDKQKLPMIPLRRFGFSDKRIQKAFNNLKRVQEEILKKEQGYVE